MPLTDKTMDWLSQATLDVLLNTRGKACVTIYIPTHRKGRESQQGSIRMKNLLRRVGDELKQRGFRDKDIDPILDRAREKVVSYEFWQFQSDGLAVFLSADLHRFFRLPHSFQESAWIGDRFLLKPLLPVLTRGERFFLLALGQTRVRLFQGGRYTIEEITPENTPEGLWDYLKWFDFEESIQHHAGSSGYEGGPHTPTFHGQGSSGDDAWQKQRIHEFFQQVDNGVRQAIDGQNHPLILAGHAWLQGIYRQVDHYRFTAPEGIDHYAEETPPNELHDEAMKIMRRTNEDRKRGAIDAYKALILAESPRTARALEATVAAAAAKRVDTLFITDGPPQFGRFDEASFTVEPAGPDDPEAQDLVDMALVNTLRNGGVAYLLDKTEMPEEDTPAVATLRF